MTLYYRQRLWDAGSGGRYVQYEKTIVDPTPDAGETSPNYTGAISAHAIIGVRDDGLPAAGTVIETVIAEWNGEDDSQFGAPIAFRGFGAAVNGDPELAVVPGAGEWGDRNVIRISTTEDLEGGYYFPFDVVLPVRYIVEFWIAGFVATGDCRPVVALAFLGSPALADRRGMWHWIGQSGQAGIGNHIGFSYANLEPTAAGLNNIAEVNDTYLEQGLYRYRWEVRRPNGEATPKFSANGSVKGATLPSAGETDIGAINGTTNAASIGAGWDSLAFDDCGPGIYNSGGAGGVTSFDILHFRILASPLNE